MLVALERNPTECPSLLIAGMMLLPFEGSGTTPLGALASVVFEEQAVPACTLRQVFRAKTFSTPVTTFGPRFEASVAKATTGPEVHVVVDVAVQLSARLGVSLRPFAGVVPSTVDASTVFGEQDPFMIRPTVVVSHVSRTKTCCTPPVAGPRLFAADAKATKRPSEEITGSLAAAFAGVTPSGVEAIVLKGVVHPTFRIWHTC